MQLLDQLTKQGGVSHESRKYYFVNLNGLGLINTNVTRSSHLAPKSGLTAL